RCLPDCGPLTQYAPAPQTQRARADTPRAQAQRSRTQRARGDTPGAALVLVGEVGYCVWQACSLVTSVPALATHAASFEALSVALFAVFDAALEPDDFVACWICLLASLIA